jgi:hypothetical protein
MSCKALRSAQLVFAKTAINASAQEHQFLKQWSRNGDFSHVRYVIEVDGIAKAEYRIL